MKGRTRAALVAAAPDIAKGVRAAAVMLAPFYLASALHRPMLVWTALGGWLGTLADPGGSRATRARTLAAFGVSGTLVVAAFELLASHPWVAMLALSAAAFAFSLLRAIGGTAGSVGTLLVVVAAIAGAGARASPLVDALAFAAGALAATALSSVVWPVWTHLPARRAIAAVYRELAAYADAAAALANDPAAGHAEWTALARERHRSIRDRTEAARAVVLALRARRSGETRLGENVRALLAASEIRFGQLVTLAQEVEARERAARREILAYLPSIAELFRGVERALVVKVIGGAESSRRTSLPATRSPALAVAHALERAAADDLELAENLDRDPPAPPSFAPRLQAGKLLTSAYAHLAALKDALTPGSILLHHAVRSALAALVASIVGAMVSPAHVTWVTLTALVILQPYAGATMKRAVERVAGTILGSAAAAVLLYATRSPIVQSTFLVPLSIAAVATRPRSYRLFTFFLTPVFVILAARHSGDVGAALERAGDSLLGGLVALAGALLVFPSSEKERLNDALTAMLDAVSAYAAALPSRQRDAVAAARRGAGIAFSAAETSLERFLAEPLRDERAAAEAMMLVSSARRLGSSMTAVDTLLDAERSRTANSQAELAAVSAYARLAIAEARARLLGGAPGALPDPPEVHDAALARAAAWAKLVAGAGGPPPA